MSKTCVIHQDTVMRTAVNNEQTMSFKQENTKTWHLNSKYPPQSSKELKTKLSSFQPNMLLRSGSLDRIRQFPSYLCRRGSGGQIFSWIYNSRTAFTQALSFTHDQLRTLLFVLSVYLMVGLVAIQLAASLFVLSIVSTSLPYGMIFLLMCIFITTFIAFITIPLDTKVEKSM